MQGIIAIIVDAVTRTICVYDEMKGGNERNSLCEYLYYDNYEAEMSQLYHISYTKENLIRDDGCLSNA